VYYGTTAAALRKSQTITAGYGGGGTQRSSTGSTTLK
jgi:hypothetical protein